MNLSFGSEENDYKMVHQLLQHSEGEHQYEYVCFRYGLLSGHGFI
jgi:hypothetical protein